MTRRNPFDPPKTDVSVTKEPDGGRELREWLGLTFADLLTYIALIITIALFFIDNFAINSILGTLAVVLSITSCPLGMKRDPTFSQITNFAKMVSYPFIVLLVIAAITIRCLGVNASRVLSHLP